MIITTTNEQIDNILSGLCLRMPDGSGYSIASLRATQIGGLAAELSRPQWRGQWSLSFDDMPPVNLDYNGLTEGLDSNAAQTFLLAPMHVGADSDDLIHFVEDVYRQPVTNENYARVLQMFRLWYALVAPDEYHNPLDKPLQYEALSLRDTADKRTSRSDRRRAAVREVLKRYGWKSESDLLTAIGKGEVVPPRKPE